MTGGKCSSSANDEESGSRDQKRQRNSLVVGHKVVLRRIEGAEKRLAPAEKRSEHELTKQGEDERDESEDSFQIDPGATS